ncbi:MAG TPA: zinc-binding dehydrogenase [bacterium]|nr:zinc-binding dehydrogenase [bacterium]
MIAPTTSPASAVGNARMHAVTFRKHGGPDVLRLEEVPMPVPGPDDILVKVLACSVNRVPDLLVRASRRGMGELTFPHVLGADPAGEVVAVGSRVVGFPLGHRVVVYPWLRCGECDMCRSGSGENYCRRYRLVGVHLWGGYAEYVRVPAENVIPIPMSVSAETASALALSYTTAWHGLVTRAPVAAGDTVLVMAAGGGIGVAACQIARLHGARVIAAAGSDWKLERVRAFGAEAGVNYSQEGWAEQVLALTGGKGADAVFDTTGKFGWDGCLRVLNRRGRLVSCGAFGGQSVRMNLGDLHRNHNTLLFYEGGASHELRHLVRLVASGRLQPVIDSRFALKDAKGAQQRLVDRANFGKVILVPRAR